MDNGTGGDGLIAPLTGRRRRDVAHSRQFQVVTRDIFLVPQAAPP